MIAVLLTNQTFIEAVKKFLPVPFTYVIAYYILVLQLLLQPAFLFSQESQEGLTTSEASDLMLPESWQDLVSYLEAIKEDGEDPLFRPDPIQCVIYQKNQINKWCNRKLNYDFALGYSSLYQKATAGGPPNEAWGDDLEMWGAFSLTPSDSRHPSIIGIKVEGRNRYLSITPADLGASIGSLWPTVSTYSESDLALIQVWWEYHIIKDILGLRVGKMDITDYVDIYHYIDTDYGFIDGGLTANLTIPFPQNGLSVQLSGMVRKNCYMMAVIADANAEKTSLSMDTFFTKAEYFTSFEIGYVPTYRNGRGWYHVTGWYVDGQKKTHTPSGQGVTISLEQQIGEHFHPFIRYGYGQGANALCQQMMNIGFGIEKPFCRQSDLFLLGYTWGRPFDFGKRDQHVIESLYRIQLFPRWQLSPDLQIIINPTDNNKDNVIAVLGLRLRVSI